MELILIGLAFVGGYVAAIYTWQWIKVQVNGATAEYERLRAQADKIINSAKRGP